MVGVQYGLTAYVYHNFNKRKIHYYIIVKVIFAQGKGFLIFLPGTTVGDIIKKFIQAAPGPWPINETLSGSPPNKAMFCCTQWSTAIWSMRP